MQVMTVLPFSEFGHFWEPHADGSDQLGRFNFLLVFNYDLDGTVVC